jgi:AraC family transcriptional regulator
MHRGANPHIQQHISALPGEGHHRLKALGNTEPAGLLAVSDDLDPDRAEASRRTGTTIVWAAARRRWRAESR